MGEISIKSMVIEDVFMSSCTIWSWYEVKIQLVWWDQNVIIFIKNICCNKTNWKSGQFANWWSGGNGNIIKLSLEVTKYCSGWSIDFACWITSIKQTRFRIFCFNIKTKQQRINLLILTLRSLISSLHCQTKIHYLASGYGFF